MIALQSPALLTSLSRFAEISKLSFTRLHIFSCIGALALTFAQQYSQHWILSNILALSFAYSAISLFYLDSFATASILLAGLFFYDIWWVFGSKAVFGENADVMVSVAKVSRSISSSSDLR